MVATLLSHVALPTVALNGARLLLGGNEAAVLASWVWAKVMALFTALRLMLAGVGVPTGLALVVEVGLTDSVWDGNGETTVFEVEVAMGVSVGVVVGVELVVGVGDSVAVV